MTEPNPAQPLSPRQQAILDFEADWRAHEGGKAAAIRDRFGISASRYHQLLAKLVQRPAAAAHDPLLVLRLRRRAQTRGQAASGGSDASLRRR